MEDAMVNVANQTTALTHDMSMISLFMNASLTVKAVIVVLLLCSCWSWAIIFSKLSRLKALNIQARKFEDAFWNYGSVDGLYERINRNTKDPYSVVFLAGMKEWKNSKSKSAASMFSVKERIYKAMHSALSKEIDKVEKHTSFLATMGSTAPFIGLFGTVWGIMGVIASEASSMNMAAIAPGIAEALFATALGLVVTIPAVMAYNKIVVDVNRYQGRLESFIDEFYSIVSRKMEEESEGLC